MTVQVRTDNATNPFVLHGIAATKLDATIAQDAARTIPLAPYTVMGHKIVAAGTVTPGSNTGNGTVTGLELSGVGTPAVGTWAFTCTFVVTNGGIFKLEDPAGNIVADNIALRVGAGLVTTVVAGGLLFLVTDGTTDFAADDTFAITVTAVDTWGELDLSAVDGQQIPKGIFTGSSVTAAAIVAAAVTLRPIIVAGSVFVDENQVVLENSLTLDTVLPSGDTVREALYKIGIIAEDTVDISSYENS